MKIQISVVSLFLLLSLGCGFKDSVGSTSGIEVYGNQNIVGGIDVSAFDPLSKHTVLIYFYQKTLATDPKPEKLSLCSGAIVGKKSILTAAHCFEGLDKTKKNFVEIYFGQNNDDLSALEKAGKMINGIQFSPHPHYTTKNSLHFDIAMITLADPIPEDFSVVSLLPADVELKIGDVVTPAGFGKRVEMDAYSSGKLTKSAGLKVIEDWGTYFSVDQSSGYGICSGDSGGPTFFQAKGKIYLAGINHGNTGPGPKVTCRDKGVIEKTQTYKNWILGKIVN